MGCLDAVHGPAVTPAEQTGTYVYITRVHLSHLLREVLLVVSMVLGGTPSAPPPPPPPPHVAGV